MMIGSLNFQNIEHSKKPYTFGGLITDATQLTLSAAIGLFALPKLLNQLTPPTDRAYYNCETLYSFYDYVTFEACKLTNRELITGLSVSIPVVAKVLSIQGRHTESAMKKIANAALFGAIYGGIIGAALRGKTIYQVPYDVNPTTRCFKDFEFLCFTANFKPIILTTDVEVPNYLAGAAIGATAGVCLEIARKILHAVTS